MSLRQTASGLRWGRSGLTQGTNETNETGVSPQGQGEGRARGGGWGGTGRIRGGRGRAAEEAGFGFRAVRRGPEEAGDLVWGWCSSQGRQRAIQSGRGGEVEVRGQLDFSGRAHWLLFQAE